MAFKMPPSTPLCDVLNRVATGGEVSAHTATALRRARLVAPRKLRLNARGKRVLTLCRR